MGGVGFEPTTSKCAREREKWEEIKREAWESNPRPLGSEGESKEMKEKRCEAWESNPQSPRKIQGEN